MTETTTAVASLSEVLRHLADAINTGLPEPSNMGYHTYPRSTPIVGLTFGTDGAASVAAWVAAYGSKYKWDSVRTPSSDGKHWLTSRSFDLLGMTVQLHGSDAREPEPATELVSADVLAEDLPEFTADELAGIAADADVIVAETVAALDEPKAEHYAVDDYTCACGWKVDGFTAPEFAAQKLQMKHIGPLVEVVLQPNAETVAS